MAKIVDAHMHVIPAFFGERNGTLVHGCGYGKVLYSERGNWRPGAKRGERRVMPPSFVDTTTPPEVVLEYMDYSGVDCAVLMQSFMYGNHNEYLAKVIKKYPDRFIGAFAIVDPRKGKAAIEELDWIADLGLLGPKIEPPDMPFWLDDPQYDPFWGKLTELGLILSIDLGWDSKDNEYNFQIDRLENIIQRFPGMKVLVQHLGVSSLDDEEQHYPFPVLQRTLSLKKYPQVWFDLTGLPEFCPSEDYPFPRAQKIVQAAVDAVGAERLIWGSDFPGILPEDVTYKQTFNIVRRHCTFLTENEKDLILGENVLKLLGKR